MRNQLEPAFILHSRAYRETSLLLDIFTQQHGRIHLVAKGAKTKTSRLKALLQPFTPLWLSWIGKGELKNLTDAEPQGAPLFLKGERLFSAFYLNELLYKCLQKSDPHPELYTIYQKSLLTLQESSVTAKVLRLFEKRLLQELGYGLQLEYDFITKKPFDLEAYYQYYPEQGFTCVEQNDFQKHFKGKALIALYAEQFEDEMVLAELKRLMRIAISVVLDFRGIESRKLFTINSCSR